MKNNKSCEFINSELKAFPPIEAFDRMYGRKVPSVSDEKAAKKELYGFNIGLVNFIEGKIQDPQDFKYLYVFLNTYCKGGKMYEALSDDGKSIIDDIYSASDNEAVGQVLECVRCEQ